jgi:acyl-CoA synthetase (AMP-forming)/AMP-acid ligase II
MQSRNLIKKKLDSLFKISPQNDFLHIENKKSLSYLDLSDFIQSVKQIFDSEKINSKTPLLLWLPRGQSECSCISSLLYLGIPTMVLSEAIKPKEVLKVFQKYPFKALMTTKQLSQSMNLAAHKEMKEFDQEHLILIENPDWTASEINFSWLLNTSGSTGQSKVVMLSVDNINDRTIGEINLFHIKERSRILNILPFSHDLGLNQLLTVLYTGSTIEVFNKKLPVEFALRLQENKIDGITGMPEIWNNFLQIATKQNLNLDYSGYLTISGGSLSTDKLMQLRNIFSKARIYKTYGQTETFRSLAQDDQKKIVEASCGTFINGVNGLLIDEKNQKCALNQIGELIHFGAGTMSGYWLDDEQSKLKFELSSTFEGDEISNQVGIRTGDCFKLLPDNQFQFVGRQDDQVKISGLRFHLSEIEHCILKIKCIMQVCVVKFDDPQANHMKEKILAFVVIDNETNGAELEIKTFCAAHLEKHKIPSHIIFLQQISINSNSKS